MYRDGSSGHDNLNIYISNTPDITGLTPLKTIYRDITKSPVETGANGWYQYQVILPGEAGDEAYVAIEGVSGYGYNMFIDDIAIEGYTETNDAGVIAVTSPVSGINLTNSETVTVTVKNFGTATLTNVPVKFEVNNTLIGDEIIPGPIAINGGEVTYTFTTKSGSFCCGYYRFCD
jgi:hypothetical protein